MKGMAKVFMVIAIYLMLLSNCQGKSIIMEKNKLSELNETNDDVPIQVDMNKDDSKAKEPIVNDIAPPKHLDAVKIGRDGNINSNFHKEVFLGEDVDNFENGNYKLNEQKTKLQYIFKVIDVNMDRFLDVTELSAWVLNKTREHFNEAKQGNRDKFDQLDGDKDGKLTWNEFLTEYLGQRGYNRQDTMEKLISKKKIDIDEDLKDDVEDNRDKWVQAAAVDGDTEFLNEEQFLDFQHPEASKAMLAYLVEDFMHDMDLDDDKILTIREYMAIGSDVDVDTQDDKWAAQRREEFRNVIDQNKDGNVTKEELELYLDPLSEPMADQEAVQLISFGDDNGDEKLSLGELLKNSEFYTGSKLYNYGKSVHEEF